MHGLRNFQKQWQVCTHTPVHTGATCSCGRYAHVHTHPHAHTCERTHTLGLLALPAPQRPLRGASTSVLLALLGEKQPLPHARLCSLPPGGTCPSDPAMLQGPCFSCCWPHAPRLPPTCHPPATPSAAAAGLGISPSPQPVIWGPALLTLWPEPALLLPSTPTQPRGQPWCHLPREALPAWPGVPRLP